MRVVDASRKLPKITEPQLKYAYRNCFQHIGRRSAKGVITCTHCGHIWQGTGYLVDTLTDICCPQCRTKLTVKTTRQRVFNDCKYFTLITACEGFQVIRWVLIKCTVKVGENPNYTHSEVMQRWIAPDGKYCTLSLSRVTLGTGYIDSWIFGSEMELRKESTNNQYFKNIYDMIPMGVIYPRMKYIPEIERTGYKKGFYGQKPVNLFRILLTDNRAETLLKTGQTALMRLFMDDRSRDREKYWPSIRIAIRNGYRVKDAAIWCDYIDSLLYLGKDVRNAKYVCPSDLMTVHDKAMDKVVKIETEKEIQSDTPAFLTKEHKYRIAKGKFFGLKFTDGKIRVRMLESVREIVTEGKVMHHCVGSYYDKGDSLILSATLDEKRIETVEVSLSKLKVIQSRGVCNKITPYHEQIVNLVNDNMGIIRDRISA